MKVTLEYDLNKIFSSLTLKMQRKSRFSTDYVQGRCKNQRFNVTYVQKHCKTQDFKNNMIL